jgi:hypothetical protein
MTNGFATALHGSGQADSHICAQFMSSVSHNVESATNSLQTDTEGNSADNYELILVTDNVSGDDMSSSAAAAAAAAAAATAAAAASAASCGACLVAPRAKIVTVLCRHAEFRKP